MPKYLALVHLAMAAMLAGASPVTAKPAASKPTAPKSTASRPVVIGYLPTFKDYRPTLASLDMAKLSHINIAFVNPDPAGRIVNGDDMACVESYQGGTLPVGDIRDIVARAHASGVKVLVSLGGGEIPACSGDWTDLLSPPKRQALIDALVTFADDFGLDGIDVDLEWQVLTAIDRAGNYVPFTEGLSRALRSRGKLLTCATASGEGGMVPLGSIPHFDYVNVMSYDGVGPTWGEPGGEHASLQMARDDLAVWLARGVPKARLILGVPFYGHGFGDYARGNDYSEILQKFGPAAAEVDVQGKRCAGCAYVTYNGRPTLRAKARMAAEQAGGVMIWELTADVTGPDSLLDAVHDSLVNP